MTYSSVVNLLVFYLILSFISESTWGVSESDDSQSDTDGCARNLGDEHKNEENDEYIEPPSEENNRRK